VINIEPLDKPELKEDCLYYQNKICALDFYKRECECKCSKYEYTSYEGLIVPFVIIMIVLIFIVCDLVFC